MITDKKTGYWACEVSVPAIDRNGDAYDSDRLKAVFESQGNAHAGMTGGDLDDDGNMEYYIAQGSFNFATVTAMKEWQKHVRNKLKPHFENSQVEFWTWLWVGKESWALINNEKEWRNDDTGEVVPFSQIVIRPRLQHITQESESNV